MSLVRLQVDQPNRRYSSHVLDTLIDRSLEPITDDQQRIKRIYWENLAFHAADFNQKAKKV
jgi:hypothetical protein